MKTTKFRTFAAVATAIIALAVIGCKPEPDNGSNTPAHSHTWGEWAQTKAPTVIAEGEEERICTVCGAKDTQAVAKKQSLVEMVQVAGGTFQMGKDLGTAATGDVTPVHTVTLTGFYMSKYLVTQEQYQAVMGSNPSYFDGTTDKEPADGEAQGKRPVETVSWYDAIVFCNNLSKLEGLNPVYSISGSTDPATWGNVPTTDNDSTWDAAVIVSGANGYRLPTEAQWEYAAKGGNPSAAGWAGYTYSGSDTIGDVAWYSENSDSKTHEVGKKAANRLGLYDMSGNVWEWCWDRYGAYEDGAQTDPGGAVSGAYRVRRGGSWGSSAVRVRSASRGFSDPRNRGEDLGFRLVRQEQ